ncbi:MAG: hypothetical protein GY865_02000, partial [candidate division Zixibacteria bacterium]|nr:hypothetical protein [candidate division Zixibacteria bacterium]
MKLKSILLMLIIVSSVILYLACVKSPVESQDDPPEEELISIFREDWTESSKPVGLDQSNPKGKLIWYNPYTQISTDDIWDRELESGETGTHTIWMEYTPSDTGNISGSWAGIMQYVNIVLVENDTEQYLELRLKGDAGIIHIDMCHISEDINDNGLLDTEDKPHPISMMVNGLVDEGEDCGRDGLFDQEEPGYNEATNPDPSGDNWWYNGVGIRCVDCTDSPNDYRFINGTEGNVFDPNRYGIPDTEDLDREGDLDIYNSYVSYKIDLDNGDFRVVGSNYNGWKTYRIPLDDTHIADTIINFDAGLFPIGSYLKTIRIWLESQNDEPFTIGIASADLIGFKEPGPKGFIPRWRTMRDYQYAYGRIFDLGRIVSNHDEPSEFDFTWGDTIISIQLYYNARIGANVDYAAPFADFYVDLDDTTNYAAENAKT